MNTQDLIAKQATKVIGLFRQFSARKKIFKLIVQKIVIAHTTKIQGAIKSFLFRKRLKTNLLVNYLLKKRHQMALLIQKNYLTHLYINLFNKILEKEKHCYTLFFFSEGHNEKIQLIINISNNNKLTFDFEYCKARKVYVVYINKEIISAEAYLCTFIVNGITVCDSRYPTVYAGRMFYNKIDFKAINKPEDSDDSDFDDQALLDSTGQKRFFNLKNIEHYRKKIQEDLNEDFKKPGFFTKNKKKSTTNLSLSNLMKAEVKQAKKLQYVKSMSELIKRVPLKPILRKQNYQDEQHQDYISGIRKRVSIHDSNVEVY